MNDLLEYKCPCCGGTIGFNSETQKMSCPYCGTEFDVETLKAYDEELKKDREDDLNWEQRHENEWLQSEDENVAVYVCRSCGGEVIAEKTTAAMACPFCGNNIVMTGNLSGMLKPDLVIPFKLDKEAAKKAFLNHLEKKRLLPKVFKSQNHIEEIKGVYVPFWLFDAHTDADIRYRATRIRAWSDSRYNYTETKYYAVTRAGTLDFEAVPVDGSSKMANDLMESLEPYDMSQAVDFQTAYLAGYLADKYDVSSEECIKRANERVKRSVERVFASTVTGYASVTTENSSVYSKNGKTRYALLPAWILNTTWNGNKYVFAMNGQSGKFVGNLSVDKSASFRYFMLAAAIGAAAAFLIIRLLGIV